MKSPLFGKDAAAIDSNAAIHRFCIGSTTGSPVLGETIATGGTLSSDGRLPKSFRVFTSLNRLLQVSRGVSTHEKRQRRHGRNS